MATTPPPKKRLRRAKSVGTRSSGPEEAGSGVARTWWPRRLSNALGRALGLSASAEHGEAREGDALGEASAPAAFEGEEFFNFHVKARLASLDRVPAAALPRPSAQADIPRPLPPPVLHSQRQQTLCTETPGLQGSVQKPGGDSRASDSREQDTCSDFMHVPQLSFAMQTPIAMPEEQEEAAFFARLLRDPALAPPLVGSLRQALREDSCLFRAVEVAVASGRTRRSPGSGRRSQQADRPTLPLESARVAIQDSPHGSQTTPPTRPGRRLAALATDDLATPPRRDRGPRWPHLAGANQRVSAPRTSTPPETPPSAHPSTPAPSTPPPSQRATMPRHPSTPSPSTPPPSQRSMFRRNASMPPPSTPPPSQRAALERSSRDQDEEELEDLRMELEALQVLQALEELDELEHLEHMEQMESHGLEDESEEGSEGSEDEVVLDDAETRGTAGALVVWEAPGRATGALPSAAPDMSEAILPVLAAECASFLTCSEKLRMPALCRSMSLVLTHGEAWQPLVLCHRGSSWLLRQLAFREDGSWDLNSWSCRGLLLARDIRVGMPRPVIPESDPESGEEQEVAGSTPIVNPLGGLCRNLHRNFSQAERVEVADIEAHWLDCQLLSLRTSLLRQFSHIRVNVSDSPQGEDSQCYTLVALRGSRAIQALACADISSAVTLNMARWPSSFARHLGMQPASEFDRAEALFMHEHTAVVKAASDVFHVLHAPWKTFQGRAVRRRYRKVLSDLL